MCKLERAQEDDRQVNALIEDTRDELNDAIVCICSYFCLEEKSRGKKIN